MRKRGFTLIELLVVIAIVGLLATIVMVSLNSARAKARDAKRKADLRQMAIANEMKYDSESAYADTAGWLTNWTPNSNPLAPTYIPALSADPGGNGGVSYQYWRKDYSGYSCMTLNMIDKYAFYARLENPSAADLATISDSFDICVRDTWSMNYKVGN